MAASGGSTKPSRSQSRSHDKYSCNCRPQSSGPRAAPSSRTTRSTRSAHEAPESANGGYFCLLRCSQEGIYRCLCLAAYREGLAIQRSDRGSYLVDGSGRIGGNCSLQRGVIGFQRGLQRGCGALLRREDAAHLARLARGEIQERGKPRHLIGSPCSWTEGVPPFALDPKGPWANITALKKSQVSPCLLFSSFACFSR
ncbi:MAG: hypothetical protein QOJ99_4415 [Bryobacterales bacterium]|nr:hypothetical protein [Bryobacterales bacterium]